MSEAADIRENRNAIGQLRESVAKNTQQLENGPQFRTDLSALKEQIDTTRAAPRLVGLEAHVTDLQAAVMEQGHHVEALTAASETWAAEARAERADRKEDHRVKAEAAEFAAAKRQTPIGWLKANWLVVVVSMLCVLVLIDAVQDDVDAIDVVTEMEKRGVIPSKMTRP